MIKREIMPCLVKLFEQYPFVTVTGPRQSGRPRSVARPFPISNTSTWKHPISGNLLNPTPKLSLSA